MLRIKIKREIRALLIKDRILQEEINNSLDTLVEEKLKKQNAR